MSGKHHAHRIVMPDRAGLATAIEALRADAPVAVPTETVYGLAARADSAAAVAAIYRAKGRPDFNPLIVHVAELAQAETLAMFDGRARRLAGAFWPGALTLVLPLRPDAPVARAVTAGLPTIALRCPAHPVMRALLAQSGLALAAPSANRSGAISPTRAEHVVASLGDRIALVVDGGPSAEGIESTIVALRDGGVWQVLRPGPIAPERIAEVLGCAPDTGATEAVEAPGQLTSHYAPGKPVRLAAAEALTGEFLIGFGAVAGQVSLSPGGDLAEAAGRLYDCLHCAAAASEPRIAVAPIPDDGIGEAINDRLRRAAA